MHIAGLQKCTLLDYPGKVACTVFLPGCNFRCPFCHNYELTGAPAPLMDEYALLDFLRTRQGLLQGVCVTGGEPTLHPQLPQLLRQIRALGFSVKLDTNGACPDMLARILAEGLADYVAMDVKNAPQCYAATCGLAQVPLDKIEQSLCILLRGDTEYELRTTVCKPLHDCQNIQLMADWVQNLSQTGVKRWFLQPFADRDTVPFAGFSAPDRAETEAYRQILSAVAEHTAIRGVE